MRFSQRMGYRPIKTVLQIESMDEDLKNSLWNAIIVHFSTMTETEKSKILNIIWIHFYKLPLDKRPVNLFDGEVHPSGMLAYVREHFFGSKWFDIYDFIEFLLQFSDKLIDNFNFILQKEVAGYRIINGQVAQITSEGEIAEIEEAITSSDQWKSVNTHLNAALNFLSDRKNPDYRNSIKESISGVESFCRIVLNNPDITFGKALIELEKKHSLHGSLKGAFSALYGYTSDAGGIRHALKEDDTFSNFEDAKFMLVTCSAFINYLKAKMQP